MRARAEATIRSTAVALGGVAVWMLACGGPQSERAIAIPTVSRLQAAIDILYEDFRPDRALELVEQIDAYFRVRGNEGYQQSLNLVEDHLRAGGFVDEELARLELGAPAPTWTPRSAHLVLVGEAPVVLHSFADESGRDRATLLVGSASVPRSRFQVVDAATLAAPAEAAGRVVLGRGAPEYLFQRYVLGAGAAGVLTVNLDSYHQRLGDPTVAQFGYVPRSARGSAFGFSISASSDAALRAALAGGAPVEIEVAIDVEVGRSRATTLQAIIPGRRPDLGPVVFMAHIDEPGANDNASGSGALAELAVALRQAIATGRLPAPQRSIVSLWGQEMELSGQWLAAAPVAPIAGLVLDMVGQDPEVVSAPFLIERMPDPAAVWLRTPDEHTEWGGGYWPPDQLWGHFLNDYAILAAELVAIGHGPWDARSNPFEGGSDHVPFLQRGIPAVLGWHFTDEAYHTTHDRMERVSGAEMQRVAAALGAVALGMAAGAEADLRDALEAVRRAAETRAATLAVAVREQLAACHPLATELVVVDAWRRWYDEAISSVSTVATTPLSPEWPEDVARFRDEWRQHVDRLVFEVTASEGLAADCPSK